VNKEMYINILRRLWVAVRRKHTEKMENQNLVSVKDLLAKNTETILGHPPHSPFLAQADFSLLTPLKSAMKERRFFDATDIM
jgi:hypothetical protein